MQKHRAVRYAHHIETFSVCALERDREEKKEKKRKDESARSKNGKKQNDYTQTK